MNAGYPYIVYLIDENEVDEWLIEDSEAEAHLNQYLWDCDPRPVIIDEGVFTLIKNHEPKNHQRDTDQECPACGVVLADEDFNDHDDIECFAQAEMMRKYYNIVG